MSDNPNNTYGSIQNMMGGSIGYTKFRPAPGDEIQIGGVLNIVTDQGITADIQLNGVTVAATAGVPGGVTNNVQYKDGANFEGIAGMNFVTKDEVRLGDLAGGNPMTLSMEANPVAGVGGRGTELNILGSASTQYIGGALNIASGTGSSFSGAMTLTSGDMVLETVAGENRSITINPDGRFEVAADNILETSLFGFDIIAGGGLNLDSNSAINMHLSGGAQLEIYVDDEITADIDIHTGEITGGQSGDINIFNGSNALGGTVGDTNITAGNLNVSTTTDISLTTGNNIVNTLGTTGTNSQTVGALIVKDSVSTSVANITDTGVLNCTSVAAASAVITANAQVNTLTVDANVTQTNTTEVSPIQILTATASGIFRAMIIQDNFGYVVGATNTTLEIFDVTDPSNIISLSTLIDATAFAGSRLRIQGSTLYVLGGARVASVDVSDPSNPVILQTLIDGPIMPTSRDIDISGMYLYVACNQRLTVLNIADPSNMFVAASLFDAVNLVGLFAIKVVGPYVYTISASGGAQRLAILDITDPLLPVVVGTLIDVANFTGALDIQVRGNYAYVSATGTGGHYSAIDVSDKTAPVLASTLVLNCKSSYISGNYAYVAASTLISVVDISDPTAMTVVSNYTAVGMGNVQHMYLSGSTGYISSSTTDFATIDINGTSLSTLTVGTLKTASTSVGGGLVVQDDITTKSSLSVGQNMCVGNEFSVRSKITQTNTTDLNILQQLTLASTGVNRSLVIQGNYAYIVTKTNTTLHILDITNPSDMTVVGTLVDANFDPDAGCGIFIIGDTLYIPTNTTILSAVDVSNRTTPVTISALTDAQLGAISAIFVSGKYCYVVTTGNRLTVVDISDPEDMHVVSSITDGSNRLDAMRRIEVKGSYAYCVANTADKLTIVDISDPYLPVVVSSIIDASDFNNALGLVVTDNYLYAALGSSTGLGIVNIQDPTTPVVNTALAAGNPANIAISGDYVYLVGIDEINVINIEDPTNPLLENTTAPLVGIARNFVISGNVGYAVGLNDEFSSIDMNGTKLSTLQSGNIKSDCVQITQNLNVEGLTTLGTLSTGGSAQLGETSVTSLKTSGKNSVVQAVSAITSVSIDARSGTIETFTPTVLAANAEIVFTVNNDQVFLSDLVMLTIQDYAGTTLSPGVRVDNVIDGSFDIFFRNLDAVNALDGVVVIGFLIV